MSGADVPPGQSAPRGQGAHDGYAPLVLVAQPRHELRAPAGGSASGGAQSSGEHSASDCTNPPGTAPAVVEAVPSGHVSVPARQVLRVRSGALPGGH
jgi:hypothetical protein